MEHHIIAAYAQVAATVFIGLGQLLVIGWFLWQMQKYGKERDRVLDQQDEAMTQAFTQQGQALERQGEVLAALLRRSA